MKRIGLMGCGKVADYGHMPAIAETDELEVVALFDPNEASRKAMREKFNVPLATGDIDEFFAADLDGVTITSAAPVHAANISAAAERSLPILCEKPLAMTVAEIESIVATVEAAGVPLWVGFDYRFSPVSQTIKQLLDAGEIGRLAALRLIYNWNAHGKYETTADGRRIEQARRAGRMEEGGPMVDCGVHQIDLARYWTGAEMQRFTAAGAWADDYEAPDHMWVHMDHVGGIHSMVEISFSYCHTAAEPISRFIYELIGSDGIIRFERKSVFELRNGRGTKHFPMAAEKSFAGMYLAFAEALEIGESTALPTAHDGLEATRVAREATNLVIIHREKREI
jgi:predicted dehydrogenase